jgi:hypothetical protein
VVDIELFTTLKHPIWLFYVIFIRSSDCESIDDSLVEKSIQEYLEKESHSQLSDNNG